MNEWSRSSLDRATLVWASLTGMYGTRLTRDFGESVPEPWRSAVNTLSDAQIQRGMRRLTATGSGSTPTLPQFVKACRASGDDEYTARPDTTCLPQPQITWQVRNGNMALLSFMMANDVPQDLVPKLVETKNKIVAGTADDDDTADLSNVLRSAFAKVIA
jgi:hypothetical protein